MLFGGSSFGSSVYGAFSYTPVVVDSIQSLLDEPSIDLCWLIEIDVLSLAPSDAVGAGFGDSGFGEMAFSESTEGSEVGIITLRYSSSGYVTHVDDDPQMTYYDPRLMGDVTVDRQISGREGLNGITYLFSEAWLVNQDGGLDDLRRQYSIDGRPVRIKLGRMTDALADFGTIFTGVVQTVSVGPKSVRLSLSDGAARLRRFVNENTYAGTGALEGGDDLKGKFKPKSYGAPLNVSPPLVDSTKLIYQVNDGEINDVPAVYDRGIALTQGTDYADEAELNSSAPSAGYYRVYKLGGYFRLGSTPAGTVTADVEGDADGSYITTTADIVHRIIMGTPGLNNAELDPAAFAQMNIDAPATVQYWVGPEDQRTCEEAVDELLSGVGAFGGFNRDGRFTIAVLSDAAGVEVDGSFIESEILDLEEVGVPQEVSPIAWRASVAWQRIYTVQTDLASGVPATRVSFLATQSRIAVADDASVKSQHLLAREVRQFNSLYVDEADAITEADRLFSLWGVLRSLYRVKLPAKAILRDLGEVVTIIYSRHGLSDGRSGRVIGYRMEGSNVELMVLV